MQNTANLWVLLCDELEASRAGKTAEQCSAAAMNFAEVARESFKGKPDRLRDALEIAGDVLQASGEPGEAMRTFEDALRIAGSDTAPSIRARISTKLALGYEAMGESRDAIRCYELAIAAHREIKDHSELPTLLNNLAGLNRFAGNVSLAETQYDEALKEATDLHGPSHPEVALIANNLAVSCTDRGDLARAEELHLRALQIREESFGAIHPEVGQSMANLAVVYHARGLSRKAERLYLAAMETLGYFHAPDSLEMQRIQKNYESLPHIRSRRLSKTMKL